MHCDADGWIDAFKHKPKQPQHYQLMELKGAYGGIQQGWWNGVEWDYGRKRIKGEVRYWRHPLEGYRILYAGRNS